MFKPFILAIISTFLFSACSTPPITEEEKFKDTTFDVHGQSEFTLVNLTKDTLNFYLNNWYRLPGDHEEFETKIAPNDSFQTQLKSQGFYYYEFDFNDSSYKVFSAPNASITFYKETDSSYFLGDFDSINNYSKRMGGNYYRNFETSMNLINLTQREHYSYSDLMDKNDAVIKSATEKLISDPNQLPKWYIKLESDRLKILGAQFKLNSLLYRKRLLNIQDSIPTDFVTQIMKGIPIENEKLMGFNHFTHLLREYHQQSFYPMNDTTIQNNTSRNTDHFLEYMDTHLNPNISDLALSTYLSFRVQALPKSIKEEWFTLIENTEMRNVVLEQFAKEEKLPPKSVCPTFTATTPDSSVFQSNPFKDSIVLINFWASFCKPCIEKFDFENQLVAHFKDQPVKIINLCIESEWSQFTALIDIYDLQTINLFANPKQTKAIQEAFDIGPLPHSVLIDKNGFILTNRYRLNEETTLEYLESLL